MVIELCNKSIDIAPNVINDFEYKPEHVGFNTLIAIEKKAKNWPRVLELSRLAMSQDLENTHHGRLRLKKTISL